MAELIETPRGNRIHIAFFGLRNAGKSTLVNAFTGQPIAIVSEVAGTTTDPVSKAMEILPLGPCLVTDTAGLDDEGDLGARRVAKSLEVLDSTDIAVWVNGEADGSRRADGCPHRRLVADACARRKIPLLEFNRGDSVEALKKRIAAVKLGETSPGLLDGLVTKGDRVLCVCPIDESAPKGRLILPQVQVIRECLDRHVAVTVCQPEEFSDCSAEGLRDCQGRLLVVTDSQAFRTVYEGVERLRRTGGPANGQNPQAIALTSFSVLFARQKGDLDEFAKGLEAIGGLKDGDTVLVAEGCTHHRQCNDIGTVKIPKALERLSGRKLRFTFASGIGFDLNAGGATVPPRGDGASGVSLIVHCGGCMLMRREMLRRIAHAKAQGVPIVNYGLLLAMANGIDVSRLIRGLTG